jgi:hypothetical protein
MHGANADAGTVFAITPFLLYRYGAAMRAQSSFAKQLARTPVADAQGTEYVESPALTAGAVRVLLQRDSLRTGLPGGI